MAWGSRSLSSGGRGVQGEGVVHNRMGEGAPSEHCFLFLTSITSHWEFDTRTRSQTKWQFEIETHARTRAKAPCAGQPTQCERGIERGGGGSSRTNTEHRKAGTSKTEATAAHRPLEMETASRRQSAATRACS
jgi:hypothetical protein